MIRPTCEDTLVIKKRNLNNDYYSLVFRTYSRVDNCAPGQFIHLQLPSTDILFRRAFSIAHVTVERQELEIIFKACGRGTRLMAGLRPGDPVNLLGPLGIPFKYPGKTEKVVMLGGGVGFPPLFYLATEMVKKGYDPKNIEFFYGGRSAADILERTRIKKLKVNFRPVTEDGSLGEKGLITGPAEEFIKNSSASRLRIYGCGPEGMLKAVNELGLKLGVPGQISLEAPMPCGVGICLGCVVPLTAGGHARVCCDGPVFEIGEVAL